MESRRQRLDAAGEILSKYKLEEIPVYFIGNLDTNITVLSQQVRALNLAWSMIETGKVGFGDPIGGEEQRVAVIGAGFAGLTFCAALKKKQVNANVTLFEKCDSVLPLQLGSDSRWLHPHIYDWPRLGSEAYSAGLPVMNWTASRASDVAAQALASWKQEFAEDVTLDSPKSPAMKLYCNCHHLQVSLLGNRKINLEWVGDRRSVADPAVLIGANPQVSEGHSQEFDMVVMAVGFGLETGARDSYWRNESFAQSRLGQGRSAYIVSGTGDGAMIDLCRLRIANFRQDRILSELFGGQMEIVDRLRDIQIASPSTTYDSLNRLWRSDDSVGDMARTALERLGSRLRHDTSVFLQSRSNSFTGLFGEKRVSFQNRLLAYLLYRSGAFVPMMAKSDAELRRRARGLGIPESRILVRRGTDRAGALKSVLDESLHRLVDDAFRTVDHRPDPKSFPIQSDTPVWSGGYFDVPGLREQVDAGPSESVASSSRVGDSLKGHWRKEYLPSPMNGLAATFCAGVAGMLASAARSERLRVTLHRTVRIGDEAVLQQCCDYEGVMDDSARKGAGRTFPIHNGTIGAAQAMRRAITTRRGADSDRLERDMGRLSLETASKTMSKAVLSIAAIPLLSLGPGAIQGADSVRVDMWDELDRAGEDQQVIGVLYMDSYTANFFADEERMLTVIKMCSHFMMALSNFAYRSSSLGGAAPGRIVNTEFWQGAVSPSTKSFRSDPAEWEALVVRTDLPVPVAENLRRLNFDFSDFAPVDQR